MEPIGNGRRHTSHRKVAAGPGQHEPWGLRDVRGGRPMDRPGLARAAVPRIVADCFQGSLHQQLRPSGVEAAARGGVMEWLTHFNKIWLVDFEFCQPEGERPAPVCMVAREIRSGQLVRLWQHELSEPPFSMGPESLFIAYYSSAEWNCPLVLGWPLPARVLDLYAEFRCLTSGLQTP